MPKDPSHHIGNKYAQCLKDFGDTPQGVHWPKPEDVPTRHRIMTEVVKPIDKTSETTSILDFGCGASHYYEYILQNNLTWLHYTGLDISPEFIELSRKKFPNNQYYELNINEPGHSLRNFDYIVMNGVFTVKWDLNYDDMLAYTKLTLKNVFKHCNKGVAVNFLSAHVDWQREDLFHLEFDCVASFIKTELSRHFIFRQDYGLYEYTAYIYK